jgi:hypothetical protein
MNNVIYEVLDQLKVLMQSSFYLAPLIAFIAGVLLW